MLITDVVNILNILNNSVLRDKGVVILGNSVSEDGGVL